MNRGAGILLSITSLPSKYGIGCFSKSAYDFVDWLKAAGQTYWQILPLGPTSYGDSPYQSFSTYAGNPYFISLEALIEEGVLTEEECGVAAGSRVDAAFYLQANTFRGTTTLQLQLIDIRPSLTPSRHEAADLDLLRRLMEGSPLTSQERARLQASRGQFAAYWTALDRRLRQGKAETDTLPLLRRLAAACGGGESFLRAALALAVFQERGLISLSLQGDQMTLALNPIQGKVDLFACPYLSRLREDPAGRNGGAVS